MRARPRPGAARVWRLWGEFPRPGATPFTFWYLVVLFTSTTVLLAVPHRAAHLLLTWSSTDVAHLRRDPLRVMVFSALWLPNLDWVLYAALFSAVLAPVERRLGWRWTAAVFGSGHVVATLVTELPIAWAVGRGYLPHRAGHRLDVGVSYGFHAVLGVLVGLLPERVRPLTASAATAAVVVPLLTSADLVSGVGHVVALAIGFGWWPWLARPSRPSGPGRPGPPFRLRLRPAGRTRRPPGPRRHRRRPG
ncbi:MAG TPA: rhomboid-like protein [Mycobacteriales bacterium]|nr:rhomboid-like protein [Mycobacteriales bacterium]